VVAMLTQVCLKNEKYNTPSRRLLTFISPLFIIIIIIIIISVKLLLGWGADPNFRDKTGETPLHKAAYGNYAVCCSLLLDAGANRDIQNNQHKIAMDLTEDRNTRFALAPPAVVDEDDQPFEQVHPACFLCYFSSSSSF
jgi:hypothetical protein